MLKKWMFLFVALALANEGAGQQPSSYEVDIEPYPGVFRVTVTTADKQATTTDKKLQIVAQVHNYRATQTSVSKELTIDAGKNSATTELAVPNTPSHGWYLNSRLHLEDNDNGVRDSRDYMSVNYSSVNNWASIDYLLFVSSNISSVPSRKILAVRRNSTTIAHTDVGVVNLKKLPAFSAMLDLYESYNLIGKGTVTNDLSFLQNSNCRVQCIHTSDFFEEWKSLHGFPSILISKNDFLKLAKSEPKLDAIRKWVSVGGQLVVFDCDKGYGDRHAIFQTVSNIPKTTWQGPSKDLKAIDGYAVENSWQANQSSNLINKTNVPSELFEPVKELGKQQFIRASLLEGSITLIDDDMINWNATRWQVLVNSMSQRSVLATFGPSSSQRNFKNDYRIPGIGDPPVGAFQTLIALFVIVIGPGFYFFFHLKKKLYLLLFAVPAFSLFSVAALYMYAIINDGFSIRSRTQSVTQIDHRNEMAFSHARQVYYCGVSPPPSRFDSGAMVLDTRSEFTPATRIKEKQDRLLLSGGMIRARNPFQLTSLDCFQTGQRLGFAKSEHGDTGTITNPFETDLLMAIVHTKDGWFVAESIEAASAGTATKYELNDARARIQTLARRLDVRSDTRGNRNTNQQIWNTNGSGEGWGRVDQVIAAMRFNKVDENFLPVNSYLIISEDNPMLSNPQPNAINEGFQLHVIIGKW